MIRAPLSLALALVCVTESELFHHCLMMSLYSPPFVIPLAESVAAGMV